MAGILILLISIMMMLKRIKTGFFFLCVFCLWFRWGCAAAPWWCSRTVAVTVNPPQRCGTVRRLFGSVHHLSSRALLCCLKRLLSIQEESSALKYSQYYAFNSFPSGPQGERARSRNGMQQHKDPFGMSEVSQDKSLLLNSCHDSLDNNLHYPSQPPGYI